MRQSTRSSTPARFPPPGIDRASFSRKGSGKPSGNPATQVPPLFGPPVRNLSRANSILSFVLINYPPPFRTFLV